MATVALETLSRAVDPRGEIVDAPALRAVSASDMLSLGAGLNRNRAAWVRLQVADAIGHGEPSKQWAQSVDFETVRKGLETLAVDLCHAAVTGSGPAWEKEFTTWQTHVRNAFPCVGGISCRINSKGRDITATSAYAAAPIFKTASRGMMRAAVGILSSIAKSDITDKVTVVQEEPGDALTVETLTGAVPLSADTKSAPATLDMRDHYAIVQGLKDAHLETIKRLGSNSWSQGHAAGQASLSPKLISLYAKIERLQAALDSARSQNAALIANTSARQTTRKARA